MNGEDYRKLQDERHIAVIDAIGEVKELLEKQYGRVSTLESKVAVLEDRAPGRQGGIWGAVGGVISGALAAYFRP